MRIIDHRLCQDDGTPVPFISTPNMDMDGVLRPKYLVICTQDGNLEQAVAWLARREARASAHLVIGRDGSITQMVPFDRVAWHAGRSEWNGEMDLNKLSIGIALVNPGKLRRSESGWATESSRIFTDSEVVELVHKHETAPSGWIRFPDVQLSAAREAAATIFQAYGLTDVLGHDDIAVARKTDPGPAFPMDQFRAGVVERRAVGNAALNVDAELSVAKHFAVTKGCNVRSGPGVSHSAVLGSPLHVGNTVRELEKQNGWKRVHVLGRVNGITSITGWVREEYLEEVTEADESDAPSRRGRTEKVDQLGIGSAEQLATRYGLAASTRTIMEHAIAFAAATPAHTVTSTFLLIVVGHSGWPTDRPAHAPDWLRGRLGSAFEVLRDSYFRRKGVNAEPVADKGNASVVLSTGATLALETARKIAEQTTGRPAPHNRHLLAALLVDARGADGSDALRVLAAAGIDPVRLRETFFEFVAAGDDDVDAWARVLLGDHRESRRLSGFHADVGGGDDYLDVRPDVLALARLIAARTLTPPLSIGLFGEWGSGKTFFMRMLRDEVERLAREARARREMQRELPFYKRIVQIEFNAWHYSEGNLWASLVQHIFENLRLVDERHPAASAELQEPFLEKLNVEKAAEAQARRERDDAEEQRVAAERTLRAARLRFERKAKALARVSGENFLADLPVQDVRKAVDPALRALGLGALSGDARELRGAVAEARALLTRGRAVLAPLIHGDVAAREREWMNLLLVLLAGPAAAVAAGGLLWALGADGIADVTALAAGAAGVIQGGTRWLKRQTARVGGWVETVETAHRDLDARIARAQAENTAKVREAEELLRLREADYAAARRREEEARRRVDEAAARLREATATKLLRSFIEERANSIDYRKHLGVLALIRNDFERLSSFIEEENWRLSPAVPGENRLRWPNSRFETLEEEEADEAKRINRIVLYIDDLDRCPPAKVVEVLQAVHLLLAFPLFVVVVGVDARWITRSLETRYRQLLSVDGGAQDQAEAMDEFQELFGTATSHDYLEKIFQVPFVLAEADERPRLPPDGDWPPAGQCRCRPPVGRSGRGDRRHGSAV